MGSKSLSSLPMEQQRKWSILDEQYYHYYHNHPYDHNNPYHQHQHQQQHKHQEQYQYQQQQEQQHHHHHHHHQHYQQVQNLRHGYHNQNYPPWTPDPEYFYYDDHYPDPCSSPIHHAAAYPPPIPLHSPYTRCDSCRVPTVQAVSVECHWPRLLPPSHTFPPLFSPPNNESVYPWSIPRSLVVFYYEDHSENNHDLFVWNPFCQRWQLVLFEGVIYPAVDGNWYQTTLLRVPRDDHNKEVHANNGGWSGPGGAGEGGEGGCWGWKVTSVRPKRKSKKVPVLALTTPEGEKGYLVQQRENGEASCSGRKEDWGVYGGDRGGGAGTGRGGGDCSRLTEFGRKIKDSFKKMGQKYRRLSVDSGYETA
ncbi:hypothetical protein MKZ38_010294 [Zalerion maritima]|uniref:Uncharacterized protein n=1 Tax=Zalerion maritima TaxID=339359 RepID=A0AAD5WSJ0_9PEZI|nr:hypothetical protein MKZ38_010294 [Zalerion maritima]